MYLEGNIRSSKILKTLVVFLFGLAFSAVCSSVVSAALPNDDFVLRKISKDVNDYPDRVEKIVVKVERLNGEPISGKEVAFSLVASSLKTLDGPDKVLTDENGLARYETWGLEGGKYFVIAEAGNQKTTFVLNIKSFSFGFLATIWPEILLVPLLLIVIYLIIIRLKSGSYVVNQKTGRGIRGVFVEIYDDLGRIVVNTVTSSAGKFSSRLEDGEYLLKVSKNGYRFLSVAGHNECGDIQSQLRITIRGSSNLKIFMEPER